MLYLNKEKMFHGLFLVEIVQKSILLGFGKLFAPGNAAGGFGRIFKEARSLIAVGFVPLVKAGWINMPAVFTVDEGAFSVIAPRSCKIDGACWNVIAAENAAAVKHKADLLL